MLTVSRRLSSYFWLVFLSTPLFVQAAILPNCDPIPGNLPPKIRSCGVEDLFQLLINIYNFLLGLAGLVLLLMIIWGGVKMILFSFGVSGSTEKDVKSPKQTITQAIIGFVIIAMAYLIVNTLVFTLLGVDGGGEVGKLLRQYF